VVTEVYVEGVLSERRFRPEGKDEPQSVEYYGESGLVRREVDTNGDGRFDRYEFPENGGLKVYEDTDADGLPDKWLKKGADDAPKGDSKSGGNAEGEPAASR
jgi:hypothetical protein